MSFDISDPADLQALNTEVFTDPIGMNYAAAPIEETASLLTYLNDEAKNVGTKDSSRDIDDVPVTEVSAVIDPVEYEALDSYSKAWINTMIAQPSGSSLRPYKEKFLAIFPNGTTTRANALALLTVPLSSRAEVLFGYGTVISDNDWFAARDI